MNTPSNDHVDQFMTLLVANQGKLYRYVRMLMPRSHDVEDVLQQAFLVMWKKFDESFAESSFYAWAAKIAYYEVLKSRDRNVRRVPLLDQEVLEQIAQEELAEPGFWDNVKVFLEACLDKLPFADRQLIERRYEPGVMVNSLAVELGRPANSVSKSLGRIRQTLLKCVSEAMTEGEASSANVSEAELPKAKGETP